MALISVVGRKSWKSRTIITAIYIALIVSGASMVTPFLITVTGSISDSFDYERFRPVPRFLWSRPDRFVKGLVPYFDGYRNWVRQMRSFMPDMPDHWNNWSQIGRDVRGSDHLALSYLAASDDTPRERRMAADYADFMTDYPLEDSLAVASQAQTTQFLVQRYTRRLLEQDPEAADKSRRQVRAAALRLLGDEWDLPFDSFYAISFNSEMGYPMDFQGWFPPLHEPKYQAFNAFKRAAAEHAFTPGIRSVWRRYLAERGVDRRTARRAFPIDRVDDPQLQAYWREFKREVVPASRMIPFSMRTVWIQFLRSDAIAMRLGLEPGRRFDVDLYNRLAGTTYDNLYRTPFPVPDAFDEGIQALWTDFVRERFPLRLIHIDPTPELRQAFHAFLRSTLQHLHIANALLGTEHSAWDQFELVSGALDARTEAEINRREVWKNFVNTLPAEVRILRSSEIAFQRFLLSRYGSLEQVNAAYGNDWAFIEEAFPPFMTAYNRMFRTTGTRQVLASVGDNYRIVLEFLLLNSNAIFVTVVLVLLTIAFTLTVNPLAAYALSRFNLRGQDMIMVFLLATMAFPAMVSAIPAYLLMRDLGLLNTFWALVLPGAANGMAIFILKGFFDSLPMELFEAATIDGASEMQIFRIVAMPLVKPILAINSLTAFIAAYNGWQWALIICQKQSMWTIAVWIYQVSFWWSASPWLVSAGFVIASIPTLVMFISCQKIILRGIIIPSMK